ncbi:MAG: Dabb family protein [Balneolaceae bacterium]|nr:Dabb family protein [Balneolaceae bacterium]
MKKKTLIFVAIISAISGLLTLVSGEIKPEAQDQILRHVVLLDLNEKATGAVVREMKNELQGLKENIPQIRELEFGTNIQNGTDYSHCMLLTFDDVESLKEYENHPMHLEFASRYGKYVEKKTEVDYWR